MYTVSSDGRILHDYGVKMWHFQWDNDDDTSNKYINWYNAAHPLSVNMKGDKIWVVSQNHLDYLRAFVTAEIRIQPEHYTTSIFAQLPYFYRSKKYRKEVLRKLDELEILLKKRNKQLLK